MAARWPPLLLLSRERLVPDGLRIVGVFAEALATVGFVFAPVAFKPHDLGIAFVSENVGSDAVQEPAVMRDNHSTARELENSLFQSSSRNKRLPGFCRFFAMSTRLRSPPESVVSFFCWAAPVKLKSPQ